MKREHRPCAREMQPGLDILANHQGGCNGCSRVTLITWGKLCP